MCENHWWIIPKLNKKSLYYFIYYFIVYMLLLWLENLENDKNFTWLITSPLFVVVGQLIVALLRHTNTLSDVTQTHCVTSLRLTVLPTFLSWSHLFSNCHQIDYRSLINELNTWYFHWKVCKNIKIITIAKVIHTVVSSKFLVKWDVKQNKLDYSLYIVHWVHTYTQLDRGLPFATL